VKNSKKIIFLSLGSNSGNRLTNLLRCIKYISEIENFSILTCSSIFETEPVGYMEQQYFYNMVLKGVYKNAPHKLLQELQLIENEMGRTREFRWGPRSMDIDILYFADLVLNSADLILPHAEIGNRKFVLEPLQEIDSEFLCPEKGITISDIYRRCSDKSYVRRIYSSLNPLSS